MSKSLNILCFIILIILLNSCSNNTIQNNTENIESAEANMHMPESIISEDNQKKVYYKMPLLEFIQLFNNAVYVDDHGFGSHLLLYKDQNGAYIYIESTGSFASSDSKVMSCTIDYKGQTYTLIKNKNFTDITIEDITT